MNLWGGDISHLNHHSIQSPFILELWTECKNVTDMVDTRKLGSGLDEALESFLGGLCLQASCNSFWEVSRDLRRTATTANHPHHLSSSKASECQHPAMASFCSPGSSVGSAKCAVVNWGLGWKSEQSDMSPVYLTYVLGPSLPGHLLTPLRLILEGLPVIQTECTRVHLCQHLSSTCQV